VAVGILILAMIAATGCRDRLEERIGEMYDLEDRLQIATEGFRGDVRLLQPQWDVTTALEEATDYDTRFLDFVRERFRIEDAYRNGRAGRVESLRAVSDFLERGRAFLAQVEGRRDEILAVRGMADQATERFAAVLALAETLRREIADLEDAKRKVVFEAQVFTIDSGIGDARQLVETGMREYQVDPDPARVAFEAGLNLLGEIEASLRRLLEDVRAEASK